MKNIIITFAILLFSYSCKAQELLDPQSTILPLQEMHKYVGGDIGGIPRHITYVKDVDNLLDKFTGTWQGVHNNREFIFQIEKATVKPLRVQEDILVMRYEIKENNTVLENTMDIADIDNFLVIKGYYLSEQGSYALTYVGREGNCGQMGTIFIDRNGDDLELFLIPKRGIVDEEYCPSFTYQEIIFREQKIVLTRQ